MDESTFIRRVVVVTLAAILVAVIAVLLSGLFHPNVDNKAIFEILGPAFQTVVGAFVGVLSSSFRGGKSPD